MAISNALAAARQGWASVAPVTTDIATKDLFGGFGSSSSGGSVISSFGTGPLQVTSRNLLAMGNANPAFFRALTILSNSLAAVPWFLRTKTQKGKGGKKKAIPLSVLTCSDPKARAAQFALVTGEELPPIVEHPFLDFLAAGSPLLPGLISQRLSFAYDANVGEWFWMLVAAQDGIPFHYVVVPPTWIERFPSPQAPSYDVNFSGVTKIVPMENMIHHKTPSYVNPYGRGSGAGSALSDELDTDEYASALLRHLLANKGFVDMLVAVQGGSKTKLDRVEAQYNQRHTGFNQAGRALFFGAERLQVERVTHDLSELRLLELREFEWVAVGRVFNIPPEIMGDLTNSNNAAIKEAPRIFAKYALIPRLELQRSTYQNRLLPLFDPSRSLLVDYVDPTPDRTEEIRETMLAAPTSTYRINEWRTLSGHKEEKWGDVRELKSTTRVLDGSENAAPDAEPLIDSASGPRGGELPKGDEKCCKEVDDCKCDEHELLWATENPTRGVKSTGPNPIVTRAVSNLQESEIQRFLSMIEDEELVSRLGALWQTEMFASSLAEFERLGIQGSFDLINPLIQEYIEEFGATNISGTTDTTKAAIRRVLSQGIANGDGIEILASRVQGVFSHIPNWRATTIARTEVNAASNIAEQFVWEASGLGLQRQWIATRDSRVREAHTDLEVTGGFKGLKELWTFKSNLEPFKGGDVFLPSHSGIAAQDINCRCRVVAFDPEHKSVPTFDQRTLLWLQKDTIAARWTDAGSAVIVEEYAIIADRVVDAVLRSNVL